jgi:hypothetical protein
MLPLILGLGSLVGGGLYVRHKRKPKGLTPERKRVYEEALKSLKDPDKLRQLADVFEKEGLKTEANMLRSRAGLRELPPEQKAARKVAFQAGMKTHKDDGSVQNPDQVEKLAGAFLSQGATGNAAALKRHAEGLRKAIASGALKPIIK